MTHAEPGTTVGPRTRRARVTPDVQAERILASGKRLFLAHGFEGTSVEMLVCEAGGSKRDIYRLFGDKRALFGRVVKSLAEEGVLAMQARLSAVPASLDAGLAAIARPFLDFLLSEQALNLHRLMVADAARLNGAGRDFIRYGPTAAYQVVERYLQDQLGSKLLPEAEAAEVARVFVDSFSADLQLRALLGDVAGSAEREVRITTAVRCFAAGLHQRFGQVAHRVSD